MKAPMPYKGNDKYVFISYSHRDEDRVYPIITKLNEAGYRVWYDSGIDPGTEWDENIAEHIQKCGYFIAFISNHYLASNNCKDELNYVRDLEKERLIVYLEEVQLPSGLAMRINRLQSIYRHKYTKDEEFYEKLFSAKGIEVCLGMVSDKKVASAESGETTKQPQMTQEQMWEAMMQSMFDAKKQEQKTETAQSPTPTPPPKPREEGFTAPPPKPKTEGFTPPPPQPRSNVYASSGKTKQKSKGIAMLLALFLGTFGAHDFYLGRNIRGVIKIILTFTGGGAVFSALWSILDLLLLFFGKTKTDAKGVPLKNGF